MDNKTRKNLSPTRDSGKGDRTDILSRNDSNRRLLEKLKGGDEDAFMEVFDRWSKPLRSFIFKITGSAQDAEDISQESFSTLWFRRDSIDLTKNIQTYIFLIAKQIAWRQMRNEKRLDESLSEAGYDTGWALATDDQIIAREVELLTEYTIAKMPSRTREVYSLFYKENLTYEQIAERLGITTGNVKSHVHIARRTLKEVIAVAVTLFFYNFFNL